LLETKTNSERERKSEKAKKRTFKRIILYLLFLIFI